MLTCTISNSLYFVFLLCSIPIAIVISDGCMSGKQAICMDLNKWCIFFIYHLSSGVYEKYTTCAQNRDQRIYIYIYICVTNMKPYDYLKLKTI